MTIFGWVEVLQKQQEMRQVELFAKEGDWQSLRPCKLKLKPTLGNGETESHGTYLEVCCWMGQSRRTMVMDWFICNLTKMRRLNIVYHIPKMHLQCIQAND
ncbi:uncharacterized protein LOC121049872 [Rosa chinensis]|uniref:uncharacterized protein LOC121049872 n=1 Tax=Rosa chinensis TaxID=74649 RepID=UPI001AD8F429|nr:uncharacterized protein LOC121049872 [Rosa chinensis]